MIFPGLKLIISKIELVWTAKIIKDVTGFTPTVMRPPLGEEDDKVRRVATAMGLSVVKWNRDSNDWRFSTWTQRDTVGGPFQPNDTPDAISRKFTTWVSQQKEGAISLQHDVYDIPSRQAAPAIDIVINADYQLTSLADCIDKPAYSDNLWTILNVPVADNPINVPRLNNSGRAASLAPATNGNKTRRAKKSGADSRRLSGALAFGVIIVAFLGLPFQ